MKYTVNIPKLTNDDLSEYTKQLDDSISEYDTLILSMSDMLQSLKVYRDADIQNRAAARTEKLLRLESSRVYPDNPDRIDPYKANTIPVDGYIKQ